MIKDLAPIDQHRMLNAISRRDFYSFLQRAFYQVYGNETFIPQWYLEYLCEYIQSGSQKQPLRLALCLPPRHLKSFICSVCLPAWYLGNHPDAEIIVASYNDEIADKLGLDCLNLMQSDFYRQLFPNVHLDPRKCGAREFATTQGGSRLATSIGGTITGRGADVLILDDPIKPLEAVSRPARQRVHEFFRSSFLTRLNNKARGIVIVVMQRVHADDLIGQIMRMGGWEVISLPAIAEQEEVFLLGHGRFHTRKVGDYLNPERENELTLKNLKEQMGERAFSAQYQQRPLGIEGALFDLAPFPRYETLPAITSLNSPVYISVDTASKTSAHNDSTAIVVAKASGRERESKFMVCDCVLAKYDFPRLLAEVQRIAQKWSKFGTPLLIIEDTALGTALIQYLRNQNFPYEIIPYTPKYSKEERAHGVLHIIQGGQVYLPHQAPWLARFLEELLNFPHGRHDDQVDALVQLISYVCNQRTIRVEIW
jgi:predicted phage terminase large subunit-like protein